MKQLLLVLLFAKLALAQSDVDEIKTTSSYHPSLYELHVDAERGIPQAQYNLGLRYDTGDEVIQSYEKSYEWFLKSANSGLESAQYALGYIYLHGHGRDKNIVEAEKWLKKAALQGHAQSQFNLGLTYDIGEDLQMDSMKAYTWFYLAMLNNYYDAEYMVKNISGKLTSDQIERRKTVAIRCFESRYQQCDL